MQYIYFYFEINVANFEMGSRDRRSKRRSKKRAFKGNQHVPIIGPKGKIVKAKTRTPAAQKDSNKLNNALEATLVPVIQEAESNVALNSSHEERVERTEMELEEQGETPKSSFSASSKIRLMKRKVRESEVNNFRFFMESSILLDLLSEVAHCLECGEKVTSSITPDAKLGLCQKFP